MATSENPEQGGPQEQQEFAAMSQEMHFDPQMMMGLPPNIQSLQGMLPGFPGMIPQGSMIPAIPLPQGPQSFAYPPERLASISDKVAIMYVYFGSGMDQKLAINEGVSRRLGTTPTQINQWATQFEQLVDYATQLGPERAKRVYRLPPKVVRSRKEDALVPAGEEANLRPGIKGTGLRLRAYQCPVCPKAYTVVTSCSRHIKKEHGESVNKQFLIAAGHERVRKFIDEGVTDSMLIQAGLKPSMGRIISEEEKPLRCKFCGRRFAHSGGLGRHIAYFHEQRKFSRVESLEDPRYSSSCVTGNDGTLVQFPIPPSGPKTLVIQDPLTGEPIIISRNQNRKTGRHNFNLAATHPPYFQAPMGANLLPQGGVSGYLPGAMQQPTGRSTKSAMSFQMFTSMVPTALPSHAKVENAGMGASSATPLVLVLIPGSTCVVGRGKDCDLRIQEVGGGDIGITETTVSRRHCEIVVHEDSLRVVINDLGSANETYVTQHGLGLGSQGGMQQVKPGEPYEATPSAEGIRLRCGNVFLSILVNAGPIIGPPSIMPAMPSLQTPMGGPLGPPFPPMSHMAQMSTQIPTQAPPMTQSMASQIQQ